MFSLVFVCLCTGRSMWPLPTMHCTSLYIALPGHGTLGPPVLPPDTDIWWSRPETCLNLFTWEPPASDIWWSKLETCSSGHWSNRYPLPSLSHQTFGPTPIPPPSPHPPPHPPTLSLLPYPSPDIRPGDSPRHQTWEHTPCYWHLVVITGNLKPVQTCSPEDLPSTWYWHLVVATKQALRVLL